MTITSEENKQFDWLVAIIEKYHNGIYYEDVESEEDDDITNIYLEKRANGYHVIHASNLHYKVTLERTSKEIVASKLNHDTGEMDKIDVDDAYDIIFDMMYDVGIDHEYISTDDASDIDSSEDMDEYDDEQDIDEDEIRENIDDEIDDDN